MEHYNKELLKTIFTQLLIYACMCAIIWFVTTMMPSCAQDPGAPVYRGEISGTYHIKETAETLTFTEAGVWYYDSSVIYPDDDVYGSYTVDENDNDVIYCSYYIESEDEDYIDTMRVKWVSETSMIAHGAPTHAHDIITLYK